jgi:hypothetical protein
VEDGGAGVGAGGALDGAAGGCAAGVVVGEACGGSDGATGEDGCAEALGTCDGGVGCAAEDVAGTDGATNDDDSSAVGELDTGPLGAGTGAGAGAGTTGVFDATGGGEGTATEDDAGATVVYCVMMTTGGIASGVDARVGGAEFDGAGAGGRTWAGVDAAASSDPFTDDGLDSGTGARDRSVFSLDDDYASA